jgi:cytochrome c oxidase cbb3-type subunit 3
MAEQNPFPGENNTGHIWDDNVRELANPPPRWWMIGFWASVLWWVVYGILYPMWPTLTGNTKGIMGWSQMQEYEAAVAQVQEIRAQYEDQIKGMDANAILADDGLRQYTLASAKVLFGDYCAGCHGRGGAGNPGYPVLADDDWLYGGDVAKITDSIANGRKGVMTAHANILSEAEIDTLAQWVVDMSEGKKDNEAGWTLYREKGCVACHGPDADGVLARGPDGSVLATVGAANLTDGIWRFEPGGLESAEYTIAYGVNHAGEPKTRNAEMPAFGLTGKLDEQAIKKLVVYVHQLGGGQ